MQISKCLAPASLALLAMVSFQPSIDAADLSGAWASDASVCSSVFVKNGNKLAFTPNAELYGGGLIIEGAQAAGTFQKCRIKSMKNEGGDIHLIAACSTGVMVSDVPVIVKFAGEDQITLVQTDPVSMQTPLVRCRL